MPKTDEISPWDALDLDATHPDQPAQLKRKRELARNFKAVFGTPQGKWVLEYMNGLYFNRDIVNPMDKEVLVCAAIRQGEQSVLRNIHRILAYQEQDDDGS